MFPCIFAFIMVIICPFFLGIYYSMTDWNGVRESINFVGLENFRGMFQSPQFLYSFLITVEYTLINVVIVNVVSFFLSLLVTGESRLRNVYRVAFLYPT
jgi:raffinose/stachyose/melibiose transport system permease protein